MAYVIYVDITDLKDKILIMRNALSSDGFERLMRWTFTDVGKRSRTLIYRDIKQDYVVKQGWVYSGIQTAKITIGNGADISCVIPLQGKRGVIGDTFTAKGGRRGWKIRGRYRINAKIVTAGASTLPEEMSHQGGMPPFRNLSWNKVTFTRKGKKRLPIARVSGLAVPQMPLNRSKDAVATHLLEYTEQRMDHHFGRLFKG